MCHSTSSIVFLVFLSCMLRQGNEGGEEGQGGGSEGGREGRREGGEEGGMEDEREGGDIMTLLRHPSAADGQDRL